MLGLSLSPLSLRSGRIRSIEMYWRLTGAQEPEMTSVCFALLLDMLNNLSLTTGSQKLHLLINGPGT